MLSLMRNVRDTFAEGALGKLHNGCIRQAAILRTYFRRQQYDWTNMRFDSVIRSCCTMLTTICMRICSNTLGCPNCRFNRWHQSEGGEGERE